MTPSQLEHLKRIDAHLERLLDIASKRTPGEWGVNQLTQMFFAGKSWSPPMAIQRSYVEDEQTFAEPFRGWCSYADAAFIAATAGNAEAGWRATRAAIAFLEKYNQIQWGWDGDCGASELADALAESILAAFPLESLKP